ncbi:HEPN domain-containing protein [Kordia algicida OT-1]|uniref:HEPN domain-containing protein n=1 Tax=Kordia algicida OT-1 TaxID=391587 RepID=A9DW90_9FLAO|nr:HEPN domain-containing protein [Kordia algicida]EDP96526.1 hypothetical protein KAOT1_03917 [Kordia algicida OT-1]
MNEVKKWINIAKSDIESSKILLENGFYSQSYFHFQQASEKANKAYWLFDGSLQENQLKKISHNQFKPLRKNIVSEKNKIDFLKDFEHKTNMLFNSSLLDKKNIEEYENNLNKALKFIDGFKKTNSFEFEEDQLTQMLEVLEQFREIKIEIPHNFPDLVKQNLKDQIVFLKKFRTENANKQADILIDTLNDKDKFNDYQDSVTNLNRKVIKLLYVSSTFKYCSILTVQHSNTTRYPEGLNGQSPIDVYNENLPIVKNQLSFLKHLNNSLDRLTLLSENYESIKNEEITESIENIKPFKNPDSRWDFFGAKNEADFHNLFVVLKNTHKDVPENIENELINFEKLQQLSYYHYPAYGDAFSRLTRIFEMAVKAKARILNIDLKNSNDREKTLNTLIQEISVGYNNSFRENLNWGRKMRNMNAHPDFSIVYGNMITVPLIRLVNIINDIFRTKEFFEGEIRLLRKINTDYKSFKSGLWKLEHYLIHSVEIAAVRNGYSLWVFYPVMQNYPYYENGNLYKLDPLFSIIKNHNIIDNSLILITYDDLKIELIPTYKSENIEKLKHYQNQIDSTTDNVNKKMEAYKEESLGYQTELFKHLISIY